MKKTMFKAVLAAALLTGASSAFAGTLAIPNQTGNINGAGQTFVINFTPGADSGGFDFVMNAAPAANLTITAATGSIPNGTTTCSFTASSVTCFSNANSNTVDLGAGAITVTYTGGATTGAINLTFASSNFFDQLGGVEPGSAATGGTLTLNAGPSGPSLGYAPAAATAITVGASGSGTAVTSTIVVTPTGGTAPETTTLACTITGAGFAPAAVTGSPFSVGGAAGSVGLACGAAATTGTLSCTETRSGAGGGAPVVSTWPLTCATAPGFASVPAPGGTVNISGIAGTTAPGGVSITNPGTAALNISGAAVTGAGFTLGTVTAAIAPNTAGAVNVSCAVPATAGTTIPGTLTFNTNATPATANYVLSCTSLSASIPTLGWAGKALMAALMLAFGLVGFQLYRRSA
jgi:hypothetical protein